MGKQQSVFSKEDMEDYTDLTYFTRREIMMVYTKFKALDPTAVTADLKVRLPMETMLKFPELKVNPFGDRICLVFSTSKDGDCTFEDFLDMMSVFSEDSPATVKAEYAFRIFDFDGDDMLGPDDLEEIVRRLLGDEILPPSEITQLVQNLTAESDLDDDGMLSFAEFEHVLAKSHDFERAFRIRF